MSSFKEKILLSDDNDLTRIFVPEWGFGKEDKDSIYLKVVSATERDDYEAKVALASEPGQREFALKNLRARLVALCLVNEDGDRIFTSNQDVLDLGKKNGLILDKLFDMARDKAEMISDQERDRRLEQLK